jgi:hypothetical protein
MEVVQMADHLAVQVADAVVHHHQEEVEVADLQAMEDAIVKKTALLQAD